MQAFHGPPVVVVAIYQSADDAVTAALASFMTAIIASDIGSAEWALLARATHRLACVAAVAEHERLTLGS